MGPLDSAGGNINWSSHHENQYSRPFLRKLTLELPCDPALWPWALDRDAYTVLLAAVFTIAKFWNQPG